MSDATASIPFPALTPAQRLHIEIYGYVIIENLLDPSEVGAITDALYGIEDQATTFFRGTLRSTLRCNNASGSGPSTPLKSTTTRCSSRRTSPHEASTWPACRW